MRPDPYANQPERPERPKWPKLVLKVFLLLLLAVLVVVGVYAKLIVDDLSKMTAHPFSLAGLSADVSGRTNILILGKGDAGHAGENLTDTIMVLSYDRATKRVAQISIPRDIRMNIPGYGYAKVNAANADGGPELAAQTISDTLGIPIDYYVLVDFTGFKQLVDAVGGVDVDVKTALIDSSYPCDNNQYAVCGLDIEPGWQHMDGTRALQYTRCRKGTCGNDFGRAARQQEVLGLVRDKAVRLQTLLNLTELKAITDAIGNSVQTDMSARQMLEFAFDWQGAQKNNPVRLVLNETNYLVGDPAGSSDLLPADGTFAAIQDRVQNIFTEPTAASDLPQ